MATTTKPNRSKTPAKTPAPAADEPRSHSGIPLREYAGYDAERRGFVHLVPREEARRRIKEAAERLSS